MYNNGQNKVTGVDINNDHNYPFKFIHSDIFKLPESFFNDFDLIWASPPCQQFSIGSKRWLNMGYIMPGDFIAQTRELLNKTGKPYIMENVPNAPLRKDLLLCGEMFGLRVIRHRIFELGNDILCCPQPKHIRHKPRIDSKHSYYSQIAGHGGDSYSYKLDDWKHDIGINWVSDKEHLVEMIPPLYSQYIINNLTLKTNTYITD